MYTYGRPAGLSGGLDPPSADCPQPVHTDERDQIRAKLEQMMGYYGQRPFGQHWHEGHPDVKAWLADLIPRVEGLYKRPKLLRCSAEARKRAIEWWGTFQYVGNRIRSEGSFLRGGYTSVPKGGLLVRTYRLRDYNFREGNPSGFVPGSAEEAASKPAPLPVEKTEGVPFDPLVGGAGGDPTKSGANRVTALEQAAIDAGIIKAPTATTGYGGEVTATAEGGYAPGVALPALEGDVAGIPTKYLVYGGLALVAWKMLKGR